MTRRSPGSPAEVAIEAVARPLEFAARDDFAHADRVRDLEAGVASAAARALELAIPRDAARILREVRDGYTMEDERRVFDTLFEGAGSSGLERPVDVGPNDED